MDSHTHVELSVRLVSAVGGAPEAAIASLFPQIDRLPPTLHRLHAHNIRRARPITELGLAVLYGGSVEGADPYELERCEAEAPRFQTYALQHLGVRSGSPPELLPSLLAYVSHLYLDTFNQPVQPFAPDQVFCSGQWALWMQLGDFRKTLYTTAAIDRLRARIFAEPLWSDLGRHSLPALAESMLVRLCDLSRGALERSLAPAAMSILSIRRDAPARVRAAVELWTFAEERICALHRQCLSTTRTADAEAAAPQVARAR